MFLHDASLAAASHRGHYAPSIDITAGRQALQCKPSACLQLRSMAYGQSRTTISARHFAALIGRLWIGGV
jgi:hypothetical protein